MKRCCALPPLVSLGGEDPARQLRLEYRGADATANPYLALGAIVRAGLDGVRAGLPAPPILDRDPTCLDAVESKRYGVGALPASLEDSLRARRGRDRARVDGAAAVRGICQRQALRARGYAGWDIEERCRRYAAIY